MRGKARGVPDDPLGRPHWGAARISYTVREHKQASDGRKSNEKIED